MLLVFVLSQVRLRLIIRNQFQVGMILLEVRKSASYKLCQQWNKPKHGPLFDLMQRTRAHYKYAVRFRRKHEQQIEADKYANCMFVSKELSLFGKQSLATEHLVPPLHLRLAQLRDRLMSVVYGYTIIRLSLRPYVHKWKSL